MTPETARDHDPATGEVDGPERRPFAAWLTEQRNGDLHLEASEALAEVAEAVVELGKVGSLTLKVSISPSGDGAVQITDEVTARPPKPERKAALFFVDGRGNVSRTNPRQAELPLREVGKPKAS